MLTSLLQEAVLLILEIVDLTWTMTNDDVELTGWHSLTVLREIPVLGVSRDDTRQSKERESERIWLET